MSGLGFYKMRSPVTGVILAGGQNTRFSGTNKALIRVGGKCILDRIYDVFSDLFEDIILVTNDPIQYLEWNLNIVTDLFPVRSSLTGIHTGLFYMTTPYAFFAACDIPFLKKGLVETILNHIEPGVDIVIPETSKGFEPLCAIYSKKCLKPIEQQLVKQELKIRQVFQKVRVKKLPENILRQNDPDLISFYNINTHDDLIRSEYLATCTTVE
ncbi:molybdenum cofactor guanylyltransferase [Desulfobacteraceae bacterium SEEP-SAG10]|nr:molybdenum cofactor guanylyltransferase [Desulfobacteraceae bacterium SEEP-SAG10]